MSEKNCTLVLFGKIYLCVRLVLSSFAIEDERISSI